MLYLIDHSNFSYKFKSVYKNCKVSINGVLIDTSVLQGYIWALKQNVFDNIIICLDGLPEYSANILKGYKGTRNHELDDTQLSVSRLEIVQFLSKVGNFLGKNIQIAVAPLQEADQVISSIAHLASNNLPPRASFINMLNTKDVSQDPLLRYLKGYQLSTLQIDPQPVVVASTDADLKILQVLPDVFTDETTSGKGVGISTATSVKNVNRFAILPYKCIWGDISDAIEGYKIPERFVALIDKAITSRDLMDKFIETTSTGQIFEGLTELQNIIWSQDHAKLFRRNYDVCHMQYWSTPKVLSFPDYNIQYTIEKYSLRF